MISVEKLNEFMKQLQDIRFEIDLDNQELSESMYQLWLKLLDYKSEIEEKK